MSKKKKIRAEFRKNREVRSRKKDWTKQAQGTGGSEEESSPGGERVSGKGSLTRKRTIVVEESEGEEGAGGVVLEMEEGTYLKGRVLRVHGLLSKVEAEDGRVFDCATRGLLKTLSTDQRHVVSAGDIVLFRAANELEGVIERIEPRRGVISRRSKGKQHIIVSNVDLLLIIASAAEPDIKPHLIDRYLVEAEKSKIVPLICINKIDLIPAEKLQPLVGVYSQMGYRVFLLSAKTGFGIDRLRNIIRGRQAVVSGQSGVGKTSLLNSLEQGLALRVSPVSEETQKGKHTTTSAQLVHLKSGGYIVDTPGLRQFQLWDVIPQEVAGYFRDIRPYVSLCKFPDCSHEHEESCAVKDAVADGLIDVRRYESYLHLFHGDMT